MESGFAEIELRSLKDYENLGITLIQNRMTKKNPDPKYCPQCGKKLRRDSKMEICYSCYRQTDDYKQDNAAIARAYYRRRRIKEHTLKQAKAMGK